MLKHRASVLGLLADANAPRDEIVRTMTEPRPTSVMVATIYDRLTQAALGHGVDAARPGAGAGVRRAAHAISPAPRPCSPRPGARRASSRRSTSACAVRTPTRSAGLLQLGPRTRLDAATLSAWIASVEASARQAGGGWTAPALSLADLAVEFPIEHDALAAIFMNLLRNAQAAVAGQDDGRVIVRIDRARDVTGRQEVSLALGDSAPAPLTLETIEARESGRGLAIVRDLVREWRGHLVVRAGDGPVHQGGGGMLPAVTRALPRFVVCEDGTEYLDRFSRFLGDDFTFVPAADFESARACAARRGRPAAGPGLPPHAAASGWSMNAGVVPAGLDAERRRRLAETQGILILRQLRAAGVTLPAVLFADLDDDERARYLERTLAPLTIGSSHLGIREIGALLQAPCTAPSPER